MRRGNSFGAAFLLRAVLGTVAIYFINSFLASSGFSLNVGIGVTSTLVSGALGAPGVLLLYGIDLCSKLLG